MFRRNRFREAVIIFTRYPVSDLGCKTRLIPQVGPDGAARVQMLMTEHALTQLYNFKRIKPDLHIYVYYSGGTEKEMRYWIERKFYECHATLRLQKGRDLGEKLQNAFDEVFYDGFDRAALIGCDIPGINDQIVEDSLCVLKWEDIDMVLGKAEDGGYYLIGLSRKSREHLEALFKGIEWGTDKVFEQQMEAAEYLNMKVGTLQKVLRDVDVPDDLPVFEEYVGVPIQTIIAPKWSILIPVLNEADKIAETLEHLVENCSDATRLEIVLCDGGSIDDTEEKVSNFFKDKSVDWKVVHSPVGRGQQLTAGVQICTGDFIMFLHADTRLPKNFDFLAEHCLWIPGNSAGAFKFGLDLEPDTETRNSKFFKMQMKMLEWGTNVRAKYGELPYGDQAIFISRRVYNQIGGMPGHPLFEDFALVEKAKTVGHIGIVDGEPCHTSARRYQKYGYVKTTGINTLLVAAYRCGVRPQTLATWYYGKREGREHAKSESDTSEENGNNEPIVQQPNTPQNTPVSEVETGDSTK